MDYFPLLLENEGPGTEFQSNGLLLPGRWGARPEHRAEEAGRIKAPCQSRAGQMTVLTLAPGPVRKQMFTLDFVNSLDQIHQV